METKDSLYNPVSTSPVQFTAPSSTLLVSGIWQRPEPCWGEYGVTEHLQHQSGKTEKHHPHSEEGGGLRDGFDNYPFANLQVL
ncbi:hypothetical protein NQZ68_013738 [Dissostichus eleginoides]|nr:hypothetical protein NQZ68_013738 [Dissostichus eleginoides]